LSDYRGQHHGVSAAVDIVARPGSLEHGKGTRGLPRNLGDPKCSTGEMWQMDGQREDRKHPGLHMAQLTGVCGRYEQMVSSVVPPNEGNEVRWDGIRES
jgi:hypothetical protein